MLPLPTPQKLPPPTLRNLTCWRRLPLPGWQKCRQWQKPRHCLRGCALVAQASRAFYACALVLVKPLMSALSAIYETCQTILCFRPSLCYHPGVALTNCASKDEEKAFDLTDSLYREHMQCQFSAGTGALV